MPPKTVILTGASRGIGLAVAHYLLRAPQSTNLVVLARSKAALDQLASQYPGQVKVIAGDLTDFSIGDQAVHLALETWGKLDGLIVNHGVLEPVTKVADCDVEQWRKAFDINFFGALAFVKAALPALRESHGRIIFTSSGAAFSSYQGWGSYGSSKAALNHLGRTLGTEEPNVTTISIRPGIVDTQMQTELRDIHSKNMGPKDAEKFLNLKKNGGLLKPEQPGHVMTNGLSGAEANPSRQNWHLTDPENSVDNISSM
ncbi:MAG: hypothetical protein M1819_001713 [Sarea resinae]|nr:MAG: hypothetical protein M1819_001713 [Sarea resinae]